MRMACDLAVTCLCLQVRLQNARIEMEYKDKPGFFDTVIVNNDLEVCAARAGRTAGDCPRGGCCDLLCGPFAPRCTPCAESER